MMLCEQAIERRMYAAPTGTHPLASSREDEECRNALATHRVSTTPIRCWAVQVPPHGPPASRPRRLQPICGPSGTRCARGLPPIGSMSTSDRGAFLTTRRSGRRSAFHAPASEACSARPRAQSKRSPACRPDENGPSATDPFNNNVAGEREMQTSRSHVRPYVDAACAACALRHPRRSTGGTLHVWAGAIRTWLQRGPQRRALAELDDRLLRDIGVTRSQARREAAKPFWM